MRTKLKNTITSNTVDKTFRAGESVTSATVDKRDFQYTYADGNEVTLNWRASTLLCSSDNMQALTMPSCHACCKHRKKANHAWKMLTSACAHIAANCALVLRYVSKRPHVYTCCIEQTSMLKCKQIGYAAIAHMCAPLTCCKTREQLCSCNRAVKQLPTMLSLQ